MERGQSQVFTCFDCCMNKSDVLVRQTPPLHESSKTYNLRYLRQRIKVKMKDIKFQVSYYQKLSNRICRSRCGNDDTNTTWRQDDSKIRRRLTVWYTLWKYHNIFEIHLLVHLYFLGFNPCMLSIYSLISCSVFQNVHAQYFKMFMLSI